MARFRAALANNQQFYAMKIPRSESLILFAFLVCVALWAMSKCSERRTDLVRRVPDAGTEETEDRPVRHDTVVAPAPKPQPVATPQPATPAPPPAPVQYNTVQKIPGAAPARPAATAPAPTAKTVAPTTQPAAKSGTTLYVTIDGLKVRKEPGLKGETIEELALYAPVTFLNQKTEWTQEISLGYEKVTDHWVKIKTAAGKTGWVFGAGLHYYKMKREGTIGDKPAAPKKKN